MATPHTGELGYFGGLKVFLSDLMTEVEEYEETITFTFRQRWIEPLLHPVTLPFEPWVKDTTEIKRRNVPLRSILQTPQGLFMHPAMKGELMRDLETYNWLISGSS